MGDRRYILEILIEGKNNSDRALQSFGTGLDRIGHIASGILVAGAVRRIGDLFRGLGATAFEATARFDRMSVSLQSFIAGEMARGTLIDETVTGIKTLSSAELKRLEDLQNEMNLLGAETVYLEEKLQKQSDKYGENSFQALKVVKTLGEVQTELSKVSGEYEKLSASEGQLVTTTNQVLTGQMDMADALREAEGPAQNLFKWIEKLAVTSPFDETSVMGAFRAAAAYGFTINYASELGTQEERIAKAREEGVVTSQRLTKSLLDLVAATGLPSDYINNLAFAMGQVKAKGKLAAEEIRQFVNAGVGIDLMARSMGMTVSEFKTLQEQGKISADDFLPDLVGYIENNFSGASERLLTKTSGLVGGIQSAFEVLLRAGTGGFFEAVRPELAEIFEFMTSDELYNRVSEFGSRMGSLTTDVLNRLELFQMFFQGLMDGRLDLSRFNFALLFGEDVGTKINNLRTDLDEIGITMESMGFKNGAVDTAIGAGKGIIGLLLGRYAIGQFGAFLGILKGINPALLAISAAGIVVSATLGSDWQGLGTTMEIAWKDSIKPGLNNLLDYLETKLPNASQGVRDVLDPILNFDWGQLKGDIISASAAFEDWTEALKNGDPEATDFSGFTTGFQQIAEDISKQFEHPQGVDGFSFANLTRNYAEDFDEVSQNFWDEFWPVFFSQEYAGSGAEKADKFLIGAIGALFGRLASGGLIDTAIENAIAVNKLRPGYWIVRFLFPSAVDLTEDTQRTMGLWTDEIVTGFLNSIIEGAKNKTKDFNILQYVDFFGQSNEEFWENENGGRGNNFLVDNLKLLMPNVVTWWEEEMSPWWKGLWGGLVTDTETELTMLSNPLNLSLDDINNWKDDYSAAVEQVKINIENIFNAMEQRITTAVNAIIGQINNLIEAWNNIPDFGILPTLPTIPNVSGAFEQGPNTGKSDKPGATYDDNSVTNIFNNSNAGNQAMYNVYQQRKKERLAGLIA